MKFKNILIIFVTTFKIQTNDKNNVITINSKYLLSKPFEKNDHLLFFGSPKCQFCLLILPTWKTLADKALIDNIKTGSINCLSEKKICQTFKITQYPIIYLIKDNFFYKFDGIRNLQNLIDFYRDKFKILKSSSFKEISSLDQSEISFYDIYKEIILASP